MSQHASKCFPNCFRSQSSFCTYPANRTGGTRTILCLLLLAIGILAFPSDRNLTAIAMLSYQKTSLDTGRASGKMTYQGKTTTLNYVYAREDRDLLDENVYEVDLLLSERPASQIPPDESHPYALKIRINRKQSLGATVYKAGSLEASLVSSLNALAITSFTNQILEARVYSEKVILDKLQYDVKFKASIEPDEKDVPVTARTGKALPPGGGVPGKTYLEFAKLFPTVMSRQGFEQLRKYLPDNAEPASLMAGIGLSSVQVVGGFAQEKKVTLSIKALYQGSPCTGKVNLINENNQWKIIRHGLMGVELGKLAF